MALKKANYEVKGLGITLPEAYAVIRDMVIRGGYGEATFYVQNSPRENAFNLQPIETVKIAFAVNRLENPFTTAYNKAKERQVIKTVDPVTGEEKEVVTGMPFKDWEDDIVTE